MLNFYRKKYQLLSSLLKLFDELPYHLLRDVHSYSISDLVKVILSLFGMFQELYNTDNYVHI